MSQPAYPGTQPLATLILMLQQSTDLYLLGLAVKNKACLVSFDARIPLSAVRGASAKHLIKL